MNKYTHKQINKCIVQYEVVIRIIKNNNNKGPGDRVENSLWSV